MRSNSASVFDRHAVDAQDDVALGERARAGVGDDAARVYVLDVEAAHARQLSLVGELRRQLLERDAEAQAVDLGQRLLLAGGATGASSSSSRGASDVGRSPMTTLAVRRSSFPLTSRR